MPARNCYEEVLEGFKADSAASSLAQGTCGKLSAMGNKDARRREIKKPKKKEPPKHVVNQPVSRIVYNPPAPNPPTPKP
jgi:hypothetical protein